MKKTAVLDLLRRQFFEIVRCNDNQELIAIEQAIGRNLAEAIYASANMPEFKRSMMDGYAVRAADTVGCSESAPVILEVVGSSAMGENVDTVLKPGQALRISTGGMVPDGADAVVMVEYTEALESELAILWPVAPRENVIDIGDDVRADEKLFNVGKKLEAHNIGVLAMLGVDTVWVRKKPTVGIISTGDELVGIDEQPGIGQVRDVNTLNLAVFACKYGCEVLQKRCVKDNNEKIRAALQLMLATCDIVLISGGSSVGEQDCTAEIINTMGKPGVLVHGVAIKPGKPTIVARTGDKAIFGLPGHPAACIMAFLAVVAPFIQEVLLGNSDALDSKKNCVEAKSGFQLHGGQGRDVFQLVKITTANNVNVAVPLTGKSGMLSLLAQADGYIEISLDKEGLDIGEAVLVKLF
jgi:molybdopterin molybdotransferase